MRKFLVSKIVKFWSVMPRRLKLWAFMNDYECTIKGYFD